MTIPKYLFPFFCATWFVGAQEPAVKLTPALINELAEEARTNNAALWAGRARIAAAEENARSIPLWRDPSIMVGGMIASDMMRSEDGDVVYGIEQELPVFGKERAARKAAQAEVAVEEAELEYRFQIVRKELSEALFQAALADELLVLAREDLAWLSTLAAAVEQRYQAGDASQVDVLRVQNERARQTEQVSTAENARHSAYVSVNRLLNRNLIAGWARMELPEVAAPVPFSSRLLKLATSFEPRLKALRTQLEQAQAMTSATRKERLPDLAAAVEGRNYTRTGDGRSAEVLLRMTIPWFNRDKYKAAVRREEARAQEIHNEIEDYTHQVRAEIHHLTMEIDNARREALLYRDQIIPRTEQALLSAEAAWQSNTSRDAFRDVLDTRRMLIEARIAYHRAVTEQYMKMSDLVLCCGIGDLEALEMLGNEQETETTTP